MKRFSDKEYVKKYTKDSCLRAKYGITITTFNTIYDNQNGKCAICNKHQSELSRPLQVDHNHKTNGIRGLLCAACNCKLQGIKDKTHSIENEINKHKEKIQIYESMITYLNKPEYPVNIVKKPIEQDILSWNDIINK